VAAIWEEINLGVTGGGGSAHHPKFAANLVRDPTKDKHANNGARESYASQCFAVVVMLDRFGI
jgi:hypothetical protein